MQFWRYLIGVVLAAYLAVSFTAAAERGPVTNLPLPRFVSLKADEGNVRRGPSLSHRIDWVFTRRNMPLEITAEYGHWRRVRDRDGQGGWVHYSLLSGVRHVIVEGDLTPMRVKPDSASPANAYAESGVVARLGTCGLEWCRVTANGSKGWVEKRGLWGVGPGEVRE
jgi:SH3-like domain-containing protein